MRPNQSPKGSPSPRELTLVAALVLGVLGVDHVALGLVGRRAARAGGLPPGRSARRLRAVQQLGDAVHLLLDVLARGVHARRVVALEIPLRLGEHALGARALRVRELVAVLDERLL